MTPFEALIKEFPIFTVKNKTSITKNIPLKDNEELVVPAHGVVKISAAILTGIPSSTYFKMVSPSIKDLINHGVIEGKKVSSVEPASTKETEDAKSWDDKKKK
mgnify:CR=1 FL=1